VTAIVLRARTPAGPALLVPGLAAVVVARWAAAVNLVADPIVVGLAFGAGLLALAAAGGARATRPRVGSLAWGVAGGAILVLVAVLAAGGATASAGSSTLPFVPWATATVLVATGEEAVLRGVLFDALGERHGAAIAVLVTSACFALIHVPVYGWHVVPLDFGVGLWLAGVRLLSGGIAAPAMAHALADLATYWL
jgi:membrane protease YdiL (CAAX protease family)